MSNQLDMISIHVRMTVCEKQIIQLTGYPVEHVHAEQWVSQDFQHSASIEMQCNEKNFEMVHVLKVLLLLVVSNYMYMHWLILHNKDVSIYMYMC